jgi:hypothetical protein
MTDATEVRLVRIKSRWTLTAVTDEFLVLVNGSNSHH